MSKHYRDMTRDELLLLVEAQSWAALDIAQSLNCTTDWLKDEHKVEAYKNAERDAYTLSRMAFEFDLTPRGNVDISILGEGGLTRVNTDMGSLAGDAF